MKVDLARPLKDRRVLVTGASRGIGAAVARRLAASGARVALLARSKDALATLAREIGGGAIGLACDVHDTETLTHALEQLPDRMGGAPDIVVNNAGVFLMSAIHEMPVHTFTDTLAINLVAPFAVVRTLLPAMRAANRGHIVTIGSIADRRTYPGNSAYAASKHGLRALHEVLRGELRGTGVRASLISPGPVDTDIWNPIDPDNTEGFTKRKDMLSVSAVVDAVHFVLTADPELNVDELRISRT